MPKDALQGNQRLVSLDLLRALAVLAVFAHHAEGMFWRPHFQPFEGELSGFLQETSPLRWATYALFGMGFSGVPLFFIISGFCIHLPQAIKAHRRVDIPSFLTRRVLRLYPLYAVVVLVVMGALKFGGTQSAGQVTLANVLGHLVFWFHNVPPGAEHYGASPVLWSIGTEVQMYLLYALLLPGLMAVGLGRAALVFVVASVAYRFVWTWQGWSHGGAHDFLMPKVFGPARLGEWLMGAWLAALYTQGRLTATTSRRWMSATLGAVGLLAVSVPLTATLGVERFWLDIPASLVACGLTGWLVCREQDGSLRLGRRLEATVSWIASRSFSWYLVHFTCINVAVAVVARVRHVTDKDSLGGTQTMLLAVALGTFAALGAAECAYRLIEAPCHRWTRSLARPRTTSAPST